MKGEHADHNSSEHLMNSPLIQAELIILTELTRLSHELGRIILRSIESRNTSGIEKGTAAEQRQISAWLAELAHALQACADARDGTIP